MKQKDFQVVARGRGQAVNEKAGLFQGVLDRAKSKKEVKRQAAAQKQKIVQRAEP
jgi:hypothetical protein